MNDIISIINEVSKEQKKNELENHIKNNEAEIELLKEEITQLKWVKSELRHVALYESEEDPNGIMYADKDSICIDFKNRNVYLKVSDDDNSKWEIINK